jgi:acetyl-CoA acetyltransferase
MTPYSCGLYLIMMTNSGRFRNEIVPVTTELKDKSGVVKKVTIDADDGFRSDATLESLAKLKPVFSADGKHNNSFSGLNSE